MRKIFQFHESLSDNQSNDRRSATEYHLAPQNQRKSIKKIDKDRKTTTISTKIRRKISKFRKRTGKKNWTGGGELPPPSNFLCLIVFLHCFGRFDRFDSQGHRQKARDLNPELHSIAGWAAKQEHDHDDQKETNDEQVSRIHLTTEF
jgi:hypothetical protein